MTAKVAAFETAVKTSPAEGQKAVCTVPTRPELRNDDLYFAFTLTSIHTPKLAEGAAGKRNSFLCGIIHLPPAPPSCPGVPASAPALLPLPTAPLDLPSPPDSPCSSGHPLILCPELGQGGRLGDSEGNLHPLGPGSFSAHPAASHLVPRSQVCSQPSWEAEVIGSINQLN